MESKSDEVVVPVLREDVIADTLPVQTGGVRVTKTVEQHEHIVEQEIRKGHVDVKRIQTNRIVDGPQPPHKSGNTLIVPIVSEVLRIEKQWVVTEEIHITQLEQRETVRETVPVKEEHARVERLDEAGGVASEVHQTAPAATAERIRPASILDRSQTTESESERVLSSGKSILKKAARNPNR